MTINRLRRTAGQQWQKSRRRKRTRIRLQHTADQRRKYRLVPHTSVFAMMVTIAIQHNKTLQDNE